MTDHLNTGGVRPPEYTDVILWRLYGCDPRTVDPLRALAHLKVLEVESRFRYG